MAVSDLDSSVPWQWAQQSVWCCQSSVVRTAAVSRWLHAVAVLWYAAVLAGAPAPAVSDVVVLSPDMSLSWLPSLSPSAKMQRMHRGKWHAQKKKRLDIFTEICITCMKSQRLKMKNRTHDNKRNLSFGFVFPISLDLMIKHWPQMLNLHYTSMHLKYCCSIWQEWIFLIFDEQVLHL